jgi:hypothetical protein
MYRTDKVACRRVLGTSTRSERIMGSLRHSDRTFQEAILAALVLEGCTSISVINGEHHRRFGALAKCLSQLWERETPGVDQLPRVLNPAVVSGTYCEADGLVGMHHHGMISYTAPSFRVATITLSPDHAQNLLDEICGISAEVQELLKQLAQAFIAPLDPASRW